MLQNNFSGTPGFGQIAYSIRWNGASDFEQGSFINPANNSFDSSEPQQEISLGQNASSFIYNYTNDGSGNFNSFEPRGTAIGYIKRPTISNESNLCGQGLPSGIQGSNSPTDIETVRGQLENLEQDLAINPMDTPKIIQHQEVALELDQRVNQYVYETVGRGKINNAINVLSTLQTAAAELRTYGVLMTSGRYTEALQQLPIVNAYGTKYDDFVFIQDINVDRLMSSSEYTLSAKDKSALEKLAGGNGQFRGYARALLLLLEDERFYDNWGGTYSSLLSPPKSLSGKGKNTLATNSAVEVFPNPTSGALQIRGERLAGVNSIDIVNPMGRVLSTIAVLGRDALEVNIDRVPGVYLLIFQGDNGAFSQKFVIK